MSSQTIFDSFIIYKCHNYLLHNSAPTPFTHHGTLYLSANEFIFYMTIERIKELGGSANTVVSSAKEIVTSLLNDYIASADFNDLPVAWDHHKWVLWCMREQIIDLSYQKIRKHINLLDSLNILDMALSTKFTENATARSALMATNGNIVYASIVDKEYGSGLGITNVCNNDSKLWKGKNILGIKLANLRKQIIENPVEKKPEEKKPEEKKPEEKKPEEKKQEEKKPEEKKKKVVTSTANPAEQPITVRTRRKAKK